MAHTRGDEQISRPALPGRNWERLRFVLIGLFILVFLYMASVRPYTDYLWYSQDARHPEVFTIAYSTKASLFLVAFLVGIAIYAFTFTKALGVTLVYLRQPQTMGEAVVANAIGWIQRNGVWVVKVAAIVLALLGALGFSNEWQTWLLFRNPSDFGVQDPTFGADLSFFVFQLPWLTAIANYVFSVFFIAFLGTFAIYFGLEFLAALGKIEVSKPFIRTHLSMLGAGLMFAWAARLWLGRYEIGYIRNNLFTGGGYADQQKLAIQAVLSMTLIVVGLAVLVNARVGKPYRSAIWAGGAWAAAYVLGMWVYPAIVQRTWVEPNKISLESPFAARAMKMTRFAYGLDRIEERDTVASARPTAEELARSKPTLDNMRLWDPDVLRDTLEPIQGLRPYYRFHDVDVDRYTVNGRKELVMLAPRDIELEGLQPNARNWVNMRLYFTHGFGVVITAVDSASPEGRPNFLAKDIPPTTHPEIPIEKPQLYFGDFRNQGRESNDPYAIVDTKVDEFDYQSASDAIVTRWKEPRGVAVKPFFSRLAYFTLFQDFDLLLSPNITATSRILYRRSVLERARLVYPFLRFDLDPYIVVLNGRVIWVLDGYTTTARIPYAARAESGEASLNYIRNSVKVTLDAYSGEMKAYAIEPDEPLLESYRKIYPQLVLDRKSMPSGLADHLRYPEDLFMLQAGVLRQYHVKTPTSFLNNDDAWDIPVERGRFGGAEQMRAYYVQIQLPDDPKDGFFLILPMTPREKGNMSGWLAASCDPDRYGRLVLYRYPKTSNSPGPAQMDASFNQDREIANLNKLLNSEQSELVQGNLLVIPIGKSVLYVKPLFLRSASPGVTPIPELKKVVLATSDNRIVVGDTYPQALQMLFGKEADLPQTQEQTSGPKPLTPGSGAEKSRLREALELLNRSEQALKAGDFAKYGELQKRLKAALEAWSK